MEQILITLLAYFTASIPSGYILIRLKLKKDIRDYGSKSIGASNVARLLGTKYAVLVVILDGLKAVLPLIIVKFYFFRYNEPYFLSVLALVLVLGHIFPVFLKFKGGKGVATYIGVMAVLNPFELGLFLPVYVLVLMITKYTSLSSIISTIIFPIILIIFKGYSLNILPYIVLSCILAVIIMLKHKSNIIRLIKGIEPQFSFSFSSKQKVKKFYGED